MKAKLNKREKYAIGAAAAFIGLFIIIQFVLFPMIEKRDRLRRLIDVKTKTIEEMLALKSEYDTIVAHINFSKSRLAKRRKGFALFSFLDELAGETGIKNKIKYMKPSSTAQKDGPLKLSLVEMKLEAVTLKQLTAYLYRVETSENTVFVKRIAISKADKPPGTIDAVLQVETYEI
jgi:general secretion pathway protein M